MLDISSQIKLTLNRRLHTYKQGFYETIDRIYGQHGIKKVEREITFPNFKQKETVEMSGISYEKRGLGEFESHGTSNGNLPNEVM